MGFISLLVWGRTKAPEARPQSSHCVPQLAKTRYLPPTHQGRGSRPRLSQSCPPPPSSRTTSAQPYPGLGSALVFAPLRSAPRSLRCWHFTGFLLQRHRCHLHHPFQRSEPSAPPQQSLSQQARHPHPGAHNGGGKSSVLSSQFDYFLQSLSSPCFPVTSPRGKVAWGQADGQLCPSPSSATD